MLTLGRVPIKLVCLFPPPLCTPLTTQTSNTAQMGLTQGLLSAVSAGMLIYAATVEMLAGDFVFGDVAGDHHDGHGHGHGHDHDHGFSGDSDLDPDGKHPGTGTGMGRRMLAVVSLLAGVAGMGLID
jgi:zinc transporter 1/2/3